METTEVPGSRGALRDRVAEEVRAMMGRRRITGAELARAIGVPQASLQRRLAGRYPFDVDLLEVIAQHFGVPVTAFFPQSRAGITDDKFPTLTDVPDDLGQAA
jgi:transcriptional regulator with XRE-family HTH domain